MNCPTCGSGELIPARRTFEHVAEDGRTLRMDVDVLVCTVCTAVHLSGRTAREISDAWDAAGAVGMPARKGEVGSDTDIPSLAPGSRRTTARASKPA